MENKCPICCSVRTYTKRYHNPLIKKQEDEADLQCDSCGYEWIQVIASLHHIKENRPSVKQKCYV